MYILNHKHYMSDVFSNFEFKTREADNYEQTNPSFMRACYSVGG